jgi:hypothetical protein
MATFQEFIQAELPLRQVTLKGSFNPSISGQQAAIGSYFLDRSVEQGPYLRYEKIGIGETDWREVGSIFNNYPSVSYTLMDFISTEWFVDIIEKGSTVSLRDGRIYMLFTSDGSSPSHYLEINTRPVVAAYKDNIQNYGTVDSYALSSFSASKYTVQVDDVVLSKVQFSEISVLGSSTQGVASEYSILYTSVSPLVEYGAICNGGILSLTAFSLLGDMTSKQFKIVRTNFFK